MPIKFSQFTNRTSDTATTTIVGFDGNQNIKILSSDLLSGFINGTTDTIPVFASANTLGDSIISQDAGATELYINGNVGIGTSSPSAYLEIETSGSTGSDDIAIFSRSTGEVLKISREASEAVLNASSNLTLSADYDNNHTSSGSNVIFKTDASERMRIDSSGNVGINTTSPASKLQVNTGTDINAQIGLDSFGSFKLGDISNNYTGRGIYYDGNPGSEDLDVLTNTFNIAGGSGEGIKVVSGSDVQLSSPTGVVLTIDGGNSNVGIGTTSPDSKLQVDGAVQVGNDTDTASADKVGALRYYTSGNNSYVDMCMQTDASTYAWVNIVQNNW